MGFTGTDLTSKDTREKEGDQRALDATPTSDSREELLESVSPLKGKGKARATQNNAAEDREAQAVAFLHKGVLVRTAFAQWEEKTVERAKYVEALEREEEYRRRIRDTPSGSVNGTPVSDARKRRISRVSVNGDSASSSPRSSVNGYSLRESVNGNSLGDSVQRHTPKRRKRERDSIYRPPRTDEELAKRLKEVGVLLLGRILPVASVPDASLT